MVIKSDDELKAVMDVKPINGTRRFALVRDFITYVLLGMTKPHTKRGFFQLKAT